MKGIDSQNYHQKHYAAYTELGAVQNVESKPLTVQDR
jgi:hypothetical protein